MKKSITKKATKKVSKPKVLTVEQFNALSRAEQRVLIAKDVIGQVLAKKYKAKEMTYVSFNTPKGVKETADAKKNLSKVKECTVCGIGACLISATRFKNQLSLKELRGASSDADGKKATKLLKSAFTPNQLAAIECAFEKHYSEYGLWSTDSTSIGGRLTDEMQEKCKEFGRKYDKEDDRLIAIYQNIIDHKGRFVP